MAPHDLVLIFGLAILLAVEILIYMDTPRRRRPRSDRPKSGPKAGRATLEEEVATH